MTLREWLLFTHILAAVAWVGGSIILQFFAFRVNRSRDPKRTVDFVDYADLAGRVFNVAGIVVAAAGIWMVIDIEAYDFDQAWIIYALAVVGASALLGMFFHSPNTKRILAVAAERGAEDPEIGLGLRRIVLVAQIELALLVLVVYVMVFKPGG